MLIVTLDRGPQTFQLLRISFIRKNFKDSAIGSAQDALETPSESIVHLKMHVPLSGLCGYIINGNGVRIAV